MEFRTLKTIDKNNNTVVTIINQLPFIALKSGWD
jgi:hypothetical protein